MKHFILLVSILLLSASCTGNSTSRVKKISALDNIKAAKTLRVAVKTDAPPFGFTLGRAHAGFEIDIIGAVARELGIDTIRYIPVSSSERISVLTNDKADLVIANMTITRQREQDIDFSLPYFQDGQMLLVAKDSSINNYLDTTGKVVGCIKDTTGERNLRIVAPGAKLKVFHTNREMVDALKSGAVEAISTDGIVLEGIRNKHPQAGFKIVGEQFSEEPFGIGIAENQSDLRDAVNEALQRMWETGEWQSIFDTWFGEGSGYKHVRTFHVQTYPQ